MIFTFSATGNSAWAAERLAEKLDDRTADLARAMQKGEMTYRLEPGETVGFVLPVYFWGIPVLLHAFLYGLQFETEEQHYTWLVLTCGGSTGGAGEMFRALMSENDYALSAWYSVRMPDNYVVGFDPPKPEKVTALLRQAEKELDGICEDIRIRMGGSCDRHRGFAPKLKTKVFYPFYRRGRKTAKFTVTESCIGCGRCAARCPCEAIRMEEGRPKWVEDQCVFCLGCINRCPKAAIQYGRKTLRRGRYQNPEFRSDGEEV